MTIEGAGAGPTLVVEAHTAPDDVTTGRILDFLRRRNAPMLAYHPAWMRILGSGLGHQGCYLEARSGGTTTGVLPLAFVSTRWFGRFLVSLPYLNYGGVVADDDAAAARLIDEAVARAVSLDARYLELRGVAERTHPALAQKSTAKVVMWLDLPGSAEALWKGFKPEIRNQIRKAEKSGATAVWGRDELLDDFYDVFAVNMRDLGTPVFGKRLFAAILAGLPSQAELCVVRIDNQPVAGAVLLHGDGFTEVPSASSLRAYNKTCANMLLYHHLLLRAVQRGQKIFDFGRSSPDSGTFRFKKQWGAEPHDSVWQYHVRQGDIGAVRPDNPKYRRKIELWKRLPVWLTRLVGPSIIRGIP